MFLVKNLRHVDFLLEPFIIRINRSILFLLLNQIVSMQHISRGYALHGSMRRCHDWFAKYLGIVKWLFVKVYLLKNTFFLHFYLHFFILRILDLITHFHRFEIGPTCHDCFKFVMFFGEWMILVSERRHHSHDGVRMQFF
jgi:hypothetical protein